MVKTSLTHIKVVTVTAVLIFFILLSGCDSGSTSDTNSDTIDGGDGTVFSDGTEIGNPDDAYTALTGVAQKGPFVEGGYITVYALDDDFNRTEDTFQTDIINDRGEYDIVIKTASHFVEIQALGSYFNEITGDIVKSNMALEAISDISEDDIVNPNVLTTIAKPRILKLIKEEGYTFDEASEQANREVLKAFKIPDFAHFTGHFDNMNILEEGEENAVLLTVSSLIIQMTQQLPGYDDIDIEDLITNIKEDIKGNGRIDDFFIEGRIYAAYPVVFVQSILENIRGNLQYQYPGMTIPEFEKIIEKILN